MMKNDGRVIIGVGGNIGSGKTTVCQIFKDLGAHYISADEIGWEVLPEITHHLKKRFGSNIVDNERIDKKKLRQMIFLNLENLQYLNKISHPILIRKLLEKISEISAGVVVIDAALIFDWPQVYKRVDYPILVVADDKVKEHRVSQKGIDEELFRQISNSQRDENETAPMAKFIIKNNGTLAKLKEECQKIYQEAKDDC